MATIVEPSTQSQDIPQGTAYGRPLQQSDAALTQVGPGTPPWRATSRATR